MQCRCIEIGRINRDILTLDRMTSRANTISGRNRTQATAFSQLSGSASRVATPGNISSLATQISRLNNMLNDNQVSISSQISIELNTLRNSTLPTLISEDELFHKTPRTRGR